MKCHFCSVFLFFLFVPLPLPLPGQWSFSSNLTVWRREAFLGEETALPCWSSEPGKELHWLSHLGTFSPSCPPSPNPGCSRRMALRCSAVVWRQTLRGSWSLASAGSNAWILSLIFLSSWVGLCWQPRWLAKSNATGTITPHIWLKCLPLQVVSAVAPCFAVQEEGVVMVQCQPLRAKQMPVHEGVVNSLEGEAAQESNLFLQGDFSSPCFKSRISIAACWCPPTEWCFFFLQQMLTSSQQRVSNTKGFKPKS